MIEMMFAAALSGMRAAESANGDELDAVHAPIRNVSAEQRMTSNREWQSPNFTFEEEERCSLFFEKELRGFGTLRIGPLCNSRPEQ